VISNNGQCYLVGYLILVTVLLDKHAQSLLFYFSQEC